LYAVFNQSETKEAKSSGDFAYISFPALGIGLVVFPRLASVGCFPALGSSSMYSRDWHRLHVFVSSSDWFIALSAFALIGQMSSLLFYYGQKQTALI